jgi:hypothetical protein
MKRDRRRKYNQCSDDVFRKAVKQRQIAMEVWNKQLATPLVAILPTERENNRAGSFIFVSTFPVETKFGG